MYDSYSMEELQIEKALNQQEAPHLPKQTPF